ncbi:VOC family protein [Rhizobium halophytocola]|uniref:Catechol 2,3-dioxygenase-like lactoylglutathione lyase family enzyme n=1 Tax=Rhizobium halophytocola TaxID=735519 RepID=A0ABS4DSK2_9HYPH|nr:VOC family protein [Rhizobium halophytocola]MBP1848670.1 catechol 2,3-dioxygenase-like lactoylglutathione lyase family enzyme [Rhizobium halophytocola]
MSTVGRLIDHVGIFVTDIAASRRFYVAVLGALGLSIEENGEDFWCDEFYVSPKRNSPVSCLHLCFQAADETMVRAFYEAGLAAGGRDNGAPGLRPYHDRYFGAFLLDPDGNNIEAVYHGPVTRTADAIEITRID